LVRLQDSTISSREIYATGSLPEGSQCKENRDLTLRDYGSMILHTVQSYDYFLHDIMTKLRHHKSTRANDCVISVIEY